MQRVCQVHGENYKLAWRDSFRTYDWTQALLVPELAVIQIRQLLALV